MKFKSPEHRKIESTESIVRALLDYWDDMNKHLIDMKRYADILPHYESEEEMPSGKEIWTVQDWEDHLLSYWNEQVPNELKPQVIRQLSEQNQDALLGVMNRRGALKNFYD